MPDEQEKAEGAASVELDAPPRLAPDESGLVPTSPLDESGSVTALGPDESGFLASHEPGPPRRASDSDEPNERPTVAPPFDPEEFARDMLRPSAPIPAARVPRDLHTHATPPVGVDAQSVAESRAPGQATGWGPAPARRGGLVDADRPGEGAFRRKTPTSTLSLVNMAAPSVLPPRDTSAIVERPKRPESLSSLNAVDSEWAELEVATRPPPPLDSPEEDPVLEIVEAGPPRLDDEEDDEEEEAAETVRRPIPEQILANVRAAKPAVTEREMNDRVSLGDYSGALAIAEELLAKEPGHAAAKVCVERCRAVLKQMYATRIGPLDRVPVVMVSRDQLRWLSIDHRAGFVLSLVDGVSSLEMIIDVSGMPELDTLRILSELAQQRIISLR